MEQQDVQAGTDRSDAEQPLTDTTTPPAIGDEVMGILSNVEAQLDRLRQVRQTQDVELQTLAERRESLDEQEQALSDIRAQLESDRLALQGECSDLAAAQRCLAEERSSLESAQASWSEEHETMQSELVNRDRQLTAREASLKATEDELAEREASLSAAQDELDAARSTLNEERDRAVSDAKQARNELADLRGALETTQSDLSSRSDALDDATLRLESLQAELTGAREQMSNHDTAVSALNDELDAARSMLATRESALKALNEEVDGIRSSMKERDDACAALEQDVAAKTEACKALQDDVDQARAALAEREAAYEALHSDVAAERDELLARAELNEQAAADATAKLDSIMADHKAAKSDVRAKAKKIEELCARIAELESDLEKRDAALAELTSTNATLDETVRAQTQQLATAQDALESREQALQDAEQRARSAEDSVLSLESQVETRSTQLDDYKAKLELAGEKLKEFAIAIEMQSEQLERGAEAMATVEQQRRQIDRLQTDLANANVGADPNIVARKDERIEELTQALRQARGQTGGNTDVAALEQRIAEQEDSISSLRRRAEESKLAADNARREMDVQTEQIAEARTREKEQAREIERLTKEVGVLRKELDSRPTSKDTEPLQQRINDLEERLAAASATAREIDASESEEMREKIKRIQDVAVHLKRRRQRLHRVRQLAKSRNRSAPKQRTPSMFDNEAAQAQLLKLEKRRRELIELRSMLAASEKKMIRRWARPRAVLVVMWLILIAAVCAGSSWLAADRLFPATQRATVTIEAQTDGTAPLTEDEARQWNDWHTSLLRHTSFRESIAVHMKDRKLDDYTSEAAVANRIDTELGIDDSRPGELLLTLTGMSKADAQSVLDVIATALMNESREQLSARPGTATAKVRNGRRVEGQMRYSTIDPVVVSDRRIEYAGMFFGGSYLFSLLLMAVVYIKMSHAKRVFEEDEAQFEAATAST